MIFRKKEGFSLLEFILVIALITVLAGVVLLVISPGRQLANTNNAQRGADVNTILNAVFQYSIDNEGNLPVSITGISTEICRTEAENCSGLIDLSELTNEEAYLFEIPVDPTENSESGTGYEISKTEFGRVTVLAPNAENEKIIKVTR